MHTAGIYADMTVDGPEIGTLVVIVDRAKNLPNRKTMGKQNPYCAARLGKEAKKTETDQRGGQTPRWDQELRFTVHDSPDYQNLKISIFNDDKKTDLISEAWISLSDVLKPGGGQGDQWHHLTYKGKYAGEVRMELTYYDTRPRPEGRSISEARDTSLRGRHSTDGQSATGMRQSSVVRRRPLPSDPNGEQAAPTPSPRMGPRDYSAPESYSPSPHSVSGARSLPSANQAHRAQPIDLPELPQHYDNTDSNHYGGGPLDGQYDIPVSDDPYALQALEENQHTWEDGIDAPEVNVPRNDRIEALSNYSISRSQHAPLSHTHSAPILGPHEQIPQAEHDYPADYQYDRYDLGYSSPPGRNDLGQPGTPQFDYNYHSAASSPRMPGYPHYDTIPPPLPPTHRNSAPNLPIMPRIAPGFASMQYSSTPTRALHMSTSIADMSHQSGARKVTPQRHSWQDPSSFQQNYGNSAANPQNSYSQQHTPRSPPYPDQRGYDQGYYDQGYEVSPPYGRPQGQPFDHRRSGGPSDYHQSPSAQRPQPPRQYGRPYDSPQSYSPRQLPHPQSPHYRSQPQSPYGQPSPRSQQTPPYGSPRGPLPPGQSPGPPLIKPQAMSPMVTPSGTPSRPPYAQHIARKSMSTAPSPHLNQQSSMPNSPSPFAQATTPQTQTPSKILIEPDVNPLHPNTTPTSVNHPPIIGSDGRVKDPSDHLPVSSYAPEPERKTGQGRPSIQVNVKNRFGPRELRETAGNVAPAVPAKVPLGKEEVRRLEGEMARIDIGSSPTSGGGGGGMFGRFRRIGG